MLVNIDPDPSPFLIQGWMASFQSRRNARRITNPGCHCRGWYGTLADYTALAMLGAEGRVCDRLSLASDEAAAIQSATNRYS